MADNVQMNAGAGGAICAADDLGGNIFVQRVKVGWGPDGTLNDANATTPLPVAITPATSGGDSVYHVVATGTNQDKANIKASAGQVYGIHIFNNAAYAIFVKLHNNAGVPTPGVGVVLTAGVQAGLPRDLIFPNGFAFATGIAITIVKLIADNDTTSVTASDCVVDVDYK